MLLLSLHLACAPPQAAGPLPQDAYVWQQVWTPAVQEAAYAHSFRELVVLGGTLDWEEGLVLFERPALPRGSALALRVEAPPAGEDTLPALQNALAQLALAHPEAPYLQLDMDLPTRRLGEYARWMEALSQAGLPPLRITALPTWLDDPAFEDLAQAAPHYVLQLHWLDPADPTHLLDPQALSHIEQAGEVGQPFAVALPSYSYSLHFDANGEQAGLSAEQGQAPPRGGHSETLRADPAAVAEVVAALELAHPQELEALIWFRLPTAQDQNSWSLATLTSVAAGVAPVTRAELQVRATGDQLWQFSLHNIGTETLLLPELSWDSDPALWDALGSYHRNQGHLSPGAAQTLPPGASQIVAWARGPVEPGLSVVSNAP
ncbi:MAG: hypothetical protein ACI9VR_000855 [Cognaticolwellia sp.]|jgi:hypothetical protein